MGLFSRLGGLLGTGVKLAVKDGAHALGQFARGETVGPSPSSPVAVQPCGPQDLELLDKMRGMALEAARMLYGTAGWTGTPDDLEVVQRLLDDAAFPPDQRPQLQCLGVVLGDVLCNSHGCRWMVHVSGEERTPVLADQRGHAAVQPMGLLVTAASRGTAVNVHALMDQARRDLR